MLERNPYNTSLLKFVKWRTTVVLLALGEGLLSTEHITTTNFYGEGCGAAAVVETSTYFQDNATIPFPELIWWKYGVHLQASLYVCQVDKNCIPPCFYTFHTYIFEKGSSWLFFRPFSVVFMINCVHAWKKMWYVYALLTMTCALCIYTVSIPHLYVLFLVNVGLVHGKVESTHYYQANWILSWVDKKHPTVPRKIETRLNI